MAKEIVNPNLDIYEKARSVPKEAIKEIKGGRLAGFSDINPMWRIKRLTEIFGPCGKGWYYEITDKHTETAGNETAMFITVSLYVKYGEEWSKPIVGVGGSKMVAMEKQGAYFSDECVDGDCEVLTKSGWIKFRHYNGTDEIAQFNKETDAITFVKPINFIHKTSLDTYKKGQIIMTGGHRCLIERRGPNAKRKRFVDIAENIANYATLKCENTKFEHSGRCKAFRDIRCGFYGNPTHLSSMQRVGIMIACDGTLYRENKDCYVWRLEFSKNRKIERAKMLLNEARITYEEHTNKRKDGSITTSFTFHTSKVDYKTYEAFIPLGNYINLKEEVISWDGHDNTFSSTRYDNISYLQTLFALSGIETTLYRQERKKDNHNDCYSLYFRIRRKSMTSIIPYKEKCEVFCVEVPTTFFLIRKNGEIIVTGNCEKMALTDALSVAMKSLGVAADIYFSKDRTKYDEESGEIAVSAPHATPKAPTPRAAAKAAEIPAFDLNTGIKEVLGATSREQLQQIFTQRKSMLAGDDLKAYKQAIAKRDKELSNEAEGK